MTKATPAKALPDHSCKVFAADDLYVVAGVNSGDSLGLSDHVLTGDVYELADTARPKRLAIVYSPEGDPHVAPGSEIGRSGTSAHLECRHTLMSSDGATVELLMLRLDQEIYALPLSPMGPNEEYTLIASEPAEPAQRLSDVTCLSFARGTLITLASGRQMPIEALAPGDLILTRDHGAQALRYTGRATLRAIGSFAPVVITAGALGNSGDLIVSQHHRMFLYQSQRLTGLATSELLVQARHLVDHSHIFIREGGFTDWFSLIFDQHEIIYAEGIPAESLMVNDATVSRLPPDLAAEVKSLFPGLTQVQHFGSEPGQGSIKAFGKETSPLFPRKGLTERS